ncbi:hypothetical protein AB4043_19270 [Terriglobus sp. YAF25]|uniref:hypothetical protein n=1 Tax=Terriglobus sp. YAF25 TaxID=3233080 RepID=UPI003F9BFFB9
MAAPRKSKRKLYIWGGIAVVVLAAGLTFAIKASGSSSKIDASQLSKVERGDIARSVVATGKVQPIVKVEVKSKASGIVTRRVQCPGRRRCNRVRQGKRPGPRSAQLQKHL